MIVSAIKFCRDQWSIIAGSLTCPKTRLLPGLTVKRDNREAATIGQTDACKNIETDSWLCTQLIDDVSNTGSFHLPQKPLLATVWAGEELDHNAMVYPKLSFFAFAHMNNNSSGGSTASNVWLLFWLRPRTVCKRFWVGWWKIAPRTRPAKRLVLWGAQGACKDACS